MKHMKWLDYLYYLKKSEMENYYSGVIADLTKGIIILTSFSILVVIVSYVSQSYNLLFEIDILNFKLNEIHLFLIIMGFFIAYRIFYFYLYRKFDRDVRKDMFYRLLISTIDKIKDNNFEINNEIKEYFNSNNNKLRNWLNLLGYWKKDGNKQFFSYKFYSNGNKGWREHYQQVWRLIDEEYIELNGKKYRYEFNKNNDKLQLFINNKLIDVYKKKSGYSMLFMIREIRFRKKYSWDNFLGDDIYAFEDQKNFWDKIFSLIIIVIFLLICILYINLI